MACSRMVLFLFHLPHFLTRPIIRSDCLSSGGWDEQELLHNYKALFVGLGTVLNKFRREKRQDNRNLEKLNVTYRTKDL